MQFVYHGSPIQGLTVLIPRTGTHGRNWVYATDCIDVAALFLGRLGGDLTCKIGLINGQLYLRERFEGAFDLRYRAPGSIYTLSAESFSTGQTSWSKDFVCEREVEPISEMQIEYSGDFLRRLISDGKLAFYPYDDTFLDDEAEQALLLQSAIRKCKLEPSVIDFVRRYLPQLLNDVLASMASI